MISAFFDLQLKDMSSGDVVVQRSWFTETRFTGSLPFDLFQFRLVYVTLQLHAPSIKRQKQMSWSSVVKYSHIRHVNILASFILPLYWNWLLSINPSDQSSSFVAILSLQTLHGGNNYNTQNHNYQYQYAGVVFLPVITRPCLCTILLEVI